MFFYITSAFAMHEKDLKIDRKKNNLKISAPSRNEEFELADRSYSLSDIQYFFE